MPFILSEGKFFNILLYKNIYTFIYQKALLHTLFCLILKSLKAFSDSINHHNIFAVQRSSLQSIKMSMDQKKLENQNYMQGQ